METKQKGTVVWLTGLSGAGKSTISLAISERLDKDGIAHVILDGDQLRKIFPKTGFSKEDRDMHVKRVGSVAALLAEHVPVILCALISPYVEARALARNECDNFIEVYVKCPIDVCIERDVKGLYKKAISGEIKQFTGISDPYEEPEEPELILDTSTLSIDECVEKILKKI